MILPSATADNCGDRRRRDDDTSSMSSCSSLETITVAASRLGPLPPAPAPAVAAAPSRSNSRSDSRGTKNNAINNNSGRRRARRRMSSSASNSRRRSLSRDRCPPSILEDCDEFMFIARRTTFDGDDDDGTVVTIATWDGRSVATAATSRTDGSGTSSPYYHTAQSVVGLGRPCKRRRQKSAATVLSMMSLLSAALILATSSPS